MWTEIGYILGAYLIGSLPVLYIIGRLRGFDLRGEDMHLGLWRKVGYVEGAAGIIWDVGKGAMLPLIALLWLDFGVTVASLSGLAVLVGMMWSVFLRFEGEKGNSTGTGVAGGLLLGVHAPLALGLFFIPVAAGGFTRAALSLRKPDAPLGERFRFSGQSVVMPLGMIIGFAILPLLSWLFHSQDMILTWVFLAMFVLIIIKRLTAGLREDLKSTGDKKSILLNRMLYDRSYR
jgi:glycerol-3-phosphate acyltransferase PlsY